eukprot:s2867_g11.t1
MLDPESPLPKRAKTENEDFDATQSAAAPSSQEQLLESSQSRTASGSLPSGIEETDEIHDKDALSGIKEEDALHDEDAPSGTKEEDEMHDKDTPSKIEEKDEIDDQDLPGIKQEDGLEDKVSPTRSELEQMGILREIDYEQVAQTLIDQGKTGWRYNQSQTSTTNLQHFFSRYTLGAKSEPYKIEVKAMTFGPQKYQATLVTDLSTRAYVGHAATESGAKHAAADLFFRDEEIKNVFDQIPPRTSDVKAKAKFFVPERLKCESLGVSQTVMNEIIQIRMEHIYGVFRDWGFRTDLWDSMR